MQAKLPISSLVAGALASLLVPAPSLAQAPGSLNPATFAKIATIDPRFQSYNVEMVEVTGGRFWAPYTAKTAAAEPSSAASSVPTGMDPSLYRYRQPIDLANPRLRTLARALGPAYIRVSGTSRQSALIELERISCWCGGSCFSGCHSRRESAFAFCFCDATP